MSTGARGLVGIQRVDSVESIALKDYYTPMEIES